MPHLDHFPRPGESDPYRPCRLLWCPVGWLVGDCGAWVVSRRTCIYFITFNFVCLFDGDGDGDKDNNKLGKSQWSNIEIRDRFQKTKWKFEMAFAIKHRTTTI